MICLWHIDKFSRLELVYNAKICTYLALANFGGPAKEALIIFKYLCDKLWSKIGIAPFIDSMRPVAIT